MVIISRIIITLMMYPLLANAILFAQLSQGCDYEYMAENATLLEAQRLLYLESLSPEPSMEYGEYTSDYSIKITASNPSASVCNILISPLIIYPSNTEIRTSIEKCSIDLGVSEGGRNWTLTCDITPDQFEIHSQNALVNVYQGENEEMKKGRNLKVLSFELRYMAGEQDNSHLMSQYIEVMFNPQIYSEDTQSNGFPLYDITSRMSSSYIVYPVALEYKEQEIHLCKDKHCLEFEDNWEENINQNFYILIQIPTLNEQKPLSLSHYMAISDFTHLKESVIDCDLSCPSWNQGCIREGIIRCNVSRIGVYSVNIGIVIGDIHKIRRSNSTTEESNGILYNLEIIVIREKIKEDNIRNWWFALIIIASLILVVILGFKCCKRCSPKFEVPDLDKEVDPEADGKEETRTNAEIDQSKPGLKSSNCSSIDLGGDRV